MAFSLAHATADGIEAAIEAVDAAVGQGPERSMPALRAIGIDFLVDAAKQTERPDLLRRAHEAWVSAFVDELARGGAADQVLELVPKLEVDLLGEALLRPSSMEELSRLAPALPAAALQTAAHTLHEFERPAAGELGSSKTLAFVDAAVSGRDEALADYSWVMSLSDAPAELEAVTLRLAATVGGSARARRPDGGSGDDELVAVGEALAGATVRLSAQRRWGLLRSLIAAGGTDPILVGEVRRSLRDSDDVAEDYRGYEAALLTDESAFARRQSAPVARIAWNEADPEARATLTRRWLKVGRCELLGEDLARLVFTVADEAVRLGPRDPASTELARSLLETVAGRGDGTAAVRRAHLRTDLDAALARDSDGLERLGRSLNDASQALGAELLAGALGPLLVQAASPEQYGRVVEHLRGRGRDLGSAYARVIESLPKREVDSLEVLALAYWLGAQASEGASDPLRRRLLDLHAQRVGDAGSSRQTNLRDVVSALPPFQGDRVRFLDDFMDQARKLKTPWWKSLLGGRR